MLAWPRRAGKTGSPSAGASAVLTTRQSLIPKQFPGNANRKKKRTRCAELIEIKVEKKDANTGALQQNDEGSTVVKRPIKSSHQSVTRPTDWWLSTGHFCRHSALWHHDRRKMKSVDCAVLPRPNRKEFLNLGSQGHIFVSCTSRGVSPGWRGAIFYFTIDFLLRRDDAENPVWRLRALLLCFRLCRRFEFTALSARWHNQILLQWDLSIKRMK